MSDLPAETLEAVKHLRSEVEALRSSYWASFRPDVLDACAAVLMLADGRTIAEVAHETAQPEWRIRFWARGLATEGIEVVEAAYMPEQADSEHGMTFVVGLLLNSPLTIADVVAWARGAWINNGDMGVDADESMVWLVWPECSYGISITAEETSISRLRRDYMRDVEVPPVGDIRALFSEVVGDPVGPDAINRGIELWTFLDAQPGAVIRGRDGVLTIDG